MFRSRSSVPAPEMAKKKACTDLPSTSRTYHQQRKHTTKVTKDKLAKKPGRKTKNTGGTRNRASPARLVKLYPGLSKEQKAKITDAGFGGLLDIRCDYMPADLTQWLLECFDANTSELVLPGRGRILVTSEAAGDITGLPNPSNGDAVKYDMDGDAIDFIHKKYEIEGGVAPRITPFIQKLAANKESVKNLKWCHFLVDQLRISRTKMNKRNSVKGCIFFLMLLYLDSLEHNLEISDCKPRLGAWNKKLMEKVVQMDRNDDGSFGRLKLKQTKHTVIDTSIGGCFADIERFVSSKVPTCLPSQDKKRLTEAFGQALDVFYTKDEDDISDHVLDGENNPGGTNMSISEEKFSNHVSDEDSYEEEEDSYEDDEDSYQEADSEDEEDPHEADSEDVVTAEVFEQQPTSAAAQQQDDANNCPQILVSTPAPVPAPHHEPSSSERKVISRKRKLRLPDKKQIVNLVTSECLPSKTDTSLPQEDISTSKPILSPKKSIPVGQGPSSSKYDPPPSCDILGFAEQQASAQGLYQERPIWLDNTFVDNLSYEEYNRLEAEALSMIRKASHKKTSQAKVQDDASEQTAAANVFGKSIPSYSVSNQMRYSDLDDAGEATPAKALGKSIPNNSASKNKELETPADLKFHQSTSIPSAISSGTPAYQPPPRRIIKPSFAMQSPFYQEGTNPYKCSNELLMFIMRCVGFRLEGQPGHELGSPIAEIAIWAMNELILMKRRERRYHNDCCRCELRTFIQKNQLDAPEVRRVFRRSENHLDRNDMVMFPVLQKWKVSELDEEVGHYFLLVLNLRDLQFEGTSLNIFKVHNKLTTLIAGFHMLMNAEEWKGRHEPSYKESDVPNIRKLLTHRWLSHEKNDVGDWQSRLGIGKIKTDSCALSSDSIACTYALTISCASSDPLAASAIFDKDDA
ncbi:hypothetical protein EJB05_55104, partial [Eragrostis curvula]